MNEKEYRELIGTTVLIPTKDDVNGGIRLKPLNAQAIAFSVLNAVNKGYIEGWEKKTSGIEKWVVDPNDAKEYRKLTKRKEK